MPTGDHVGSVTKNVTSYLSPGTEQSFAGAAQNLAVESGTNCRLDMIDDLPALGVSGLFNDEREVCPPHQAILSVGLDQLMHPLEEVDVRIFFV